MKKLMNKFKNWWGNKSSHLTFDDVSFTGTLFAELKRWWSIMRNCFWNAIQAIYNIRKLVNTLREAGVNL